MLGLAKYRLVAITADRAGRINRPKLAGKVNSMKSLDNINTRNVSYKKLVKIRTSARLLFWNQNCIVYDS